MSDRTPEYLRVAGRLRNEISSGLYSDGDRLPTVRETSERFGVAYATASRAYDSLREAGITDSRPGVGTIVRSREAAANDSSTLEDLRSELRDLAARVERLEALHADQSTEPGQPAP